MLGGPVWVDFNGRAVDCVIALPHTRVRDWRVVCDCRIIED